MKDKRTKKMKSKIARRNSGNHTKIKQQSHPKLWQNWAIQ